MDPGTAEHRSRAVAADLIVAARALIATPYRHQGRNARGLDCIGLLLVAAATAEILPPALGPNNYGRVATPRLAGGLAEYCDPLETHEPGAIVGICWPGDRQVSHVAICAGETIIHSYQNIGRVVEHGYRGHWVKWTHSIWWIRGLARG